MTILEVKRVSYAVENKKIIENVSFTVEKGEHITLIGPSGGGKSTLLKLVASLLTPTSGDICLEGNAQSTFLPNDYRQEVSYCFQQPVLFGRTVYDNLLFPFTIRKKEFDKQKACDWLEQAALPAIFLEKEITGLSGGEKQRIAFIRNLLFLPKILLLDEVTVGLDAKNKEVIHQLIHTLKEKDRTIIQITHDTEEIKQAQRLLTMEGGKLSE